MYERSYGYKYAEGGHLSSTDIAKLIRADIKQAIAEGLLPDRWRYSVTTDYFSGGSAIHLVVKGCADAWTACPGYQALGNGVRSGCRNPWCKAGGEHRDSPHASEHDVLTEEAVAARMTLDRIHGAYNHDGSESQVDYFDVNYYGHVEFQTRGAAEFEASEKARLAAKKAARDSGEVTGRVKVYKRDGNSVTHVAVRTEDGKEVLACGARPRGFVSRAAEDAEVSCSRCAKRVT